MATNEATASVFDVAAYVLNKTGPITAMKLEKLVYYAQAWSLAWTGNAIFPDRIEAWAQGPVVPALWNEHRGQFVVDSIGAGSPPLVTVDEREIQGSVLKATEGRSALGNRG